MHIKIRCLEYNFTKGVKLKELYICDKVVTTINTASVRTPNATKLGMASGIERTEIC